MCAEDTSRRQSCFAHGMCRSCFEEYLINSGGTCDGQDPPAFTNGVQRQLALEAQQVRGLANIYLIPGDTVCC